MLCPMCTSLPGSCPEKTHVKSLETAKSYKFPSVVTYSHVLHNGYNVDFNLVR